MSIDPATAAQPTASVTVTAPAPIKAFSEGGDGPTFKDVIDIINPLQHIPVINTIYRHLTGDEEGAVADVGGGALYMGPVGLIGSLVDMAVKAESGKSIGDNILSWLGMGDDDDAPAEAAKTAEAQVQQQQAQQTAAVTAPLPAITAQALSALPAQQRGDDRKDAKSRDGKDAPAKSGEYMVFGASAPAGSNQPLSLLPSQPDAAPIAAAAPTGRDASGPSRQGSYLVFGGAQQQTPATVSVSATDSNSAGRQGDYMVFGVSVPAATPAPAPQPVQLAQAMPVQPAPVAAPAPVPVAAAAAPASATPAGLSPLPSRSFAAPARRAQVTPNSLGMPTTGPAAIPGHMAVSQAIPAVNQNDPNWFVNAVNNGLNKYAAAQKLTDQNGAAAGADAAQSFATIH